MAVLVVAAGLPAMAAGAASAAVTVTGCPATEKALAGDITQAGAGGTVSFDCAAATTIFFNHSQGGRGTLVLSQDVTLDAAGSAGKVTFSGGGETQILEVASGAAVTLDGLAFEHGNGVGPVSLAQCRAGDPDVFNEGGAIYNAGSLDIENSTLTHNKPKTELHCLVGGQQHAMTDYPRGGAIYSTGTLVVDHSVLSHNTAASSVPSSAFLYRPYGGAIDSAGGSLTIGNSILSGNLVGAATSTEPAAGSAVAANSGTLTIDASRFTRNTVIGCCTYDGGAGTIYVADPAGPATATITASTISGNDSMADVLSQQFSATPGDVSVTISSSHLSGTTAGPTASATGYWNAGPAESVVEPAQLTLGSGDTFSHYDGGAIVASIGCPCSGAVLSINGATFQGLHNTMGDEASVITGGSGTIANSTFRDNSGGPALQPRGNLTITGSTFARNTSSTWPGGAAIDNSNNTADVTVTGSRFTRNTYTSTGVNGGGITDTPDDSGGGAVYNSGTMAISGSRFTGNTATGQVEPQQGLGLLFVTGGGAIANEGSLTLTGDTLAANTASEAGPVGSGGGGVLNGGGRLTVTRSTLVGNTADQGSGVAGNGGAIYSDDQWSAAPASTTVTDSTLSGNSADAVGGAIADTGGGPHPGSLTVQADTITANTDSSGEPGALADILSFHGTAPLPDTWTIGQNIFAVNTGGPCNEFLQNEPGEPFALVTDTGYNLGDTGPDQCALATSTDLANASPGLDLAGLASHGGPTQTIALNPGSPAIDAIPVSTGSCQATDQRGKPRPDGTGETACDIGAYESSHG